MFSEWRKRSKLFEICFGVEKPFLIYKPNAYRLARASFKAGVRAGIKQEQARRKK